jgi:isocitrate dehydrogenase
MTAQTAAPTADAQPAASGERPVPVTVAHGDGIGPEIMEATLRILKAAGAPLKFETVQIGEKAYLGGHTSGIPPEAWETIRRNRAFLKAPITTPLGGGYKSLNVTIRKSLNLFANVRPTKAYAPFVPSEYPEMDLVIVRENEEDLYAGIEHQQTPEVTQVLKLITRPGTERIVRYAFDYARAHGRKRVTCMTKNNIMKHTDGLFQRVFAEVAEEYPDIESDHQIIDIGAARVAATPEDFDVIVTLNLYGDILSDIASQVAGSVGLAGSANVGPSVSMFEAIHGSAPDIAGQGIANPSGLLAGATQMLVHLGFAECAETVRNAWLKTLEDGVHTGDVYQEGTSAERVGTEAFADAVIARLGQEPETLRPVHYASGGVRIASPVAPRPSKALVGVDVFIDWDEAGRDPDVIGDGLAEAAPQGWKLKMITNRGVKVYPGGLPETFKTDHWRCRFIPDAKPATDFAEVLRLLTSLHEAGYDVIKTEHLYTFDGERAYSLGQGE